MKNEIQEILKIVKNEQGLNASRYSELKSEFKNDIQQVFKIVTDEQGLNANRYLELKSELKNVLKIVTDEQGLNTGRYYELKKSIDDINFKMATKDQLDQVYESLSQDVACLSGDHHKLKKRVTLLERKFRKLEDRIS
jgi:hypothetical protein